MWARMRFEGVFAVAEVCKGLFGVLRNLRKIVKSVKIER